SSEGSPRSGDGSARGSGESSSTTEAKSATVPLRRHDGYAGRDDRSGEYHMKPQLLFVHSAGTQDIEESSSVLLGHLKSGLESSYDILAPLMPDLEDPRYDAWAEHLGQVLPRTDAPLVLAG